MAVNTAAEQSNNLDLGTSKDKGVLPPTNKLTSADTAKDLSSLAMTQLSPEVQTCLDNAPEAIKDKLAAAKTAQAAVKTAMHWGEYSYAGAIATAAIKTETSREVRADLYELRGHAEYLNDDLGAAANSFDMALALGKHTPENFFMCGFSQGAEKGDVVTLLHYSGLKREALSQIPDKEVQAAVDKATIGVAGLRAASIQLKHPELELGNGLADLKTANDHLCHAREVCPERDFPKIYLRKWQQMAIEHAPMSLQGKVSTTNSDLQNIKIATKNGELDWAKQYGRAAVLLETNSSTRSKLQALTENIQERKE